MDRRNIWRLHNKFINLHQKPNNMKTELTIKFEMDTEGNWTCHGLSKDQRNHKSLNAGGKVILKEGNDILNSFAQFVKGLEYHCPSDYRYSISSPSK